MIKKKVIVGMSGGVDSSVAAYLLKEEGYDVIGVTMQTWQEDQPLGRPAESGCQGLSVLEDARKAAAQLGIPHYVMDFREDFKKHVIDYFIREYERACTPNPCIACNRHVKWQALLARAHQMGADYIATGHYARIERLNNGRYTVRNSVTAAKDQTYALCNLTQEQLAATLMPVGAYEKTQIRKIAEKIGLSAAAKSDSQDICFIPDHDYAAFIEAETGKTGQPGDFVDTEGKILGRHRGLIHYTIGQRKGLGLTAETPLFVKELCPETNRVVVGKNEEIFSAVCFLEDVNYMAREKIEPGTPALGKIRYSHRGASCRLYPLEGGRLKCVFEEPQRAITPGQAGAFYEEDHVLCGGRIIGPRMQTPGL